MKIHILDSETIDKIAAGEVVERPSSVVKELVENAIDAGATAVTVEIKDGGIEFIRVTDNGSGMEKDQLRTAFLRHATSKIEDAGDLERIMSLGFRGEALSSIAAVAKVEVITKTPESITGSRILLEGAREIAFDEVGAPDGTTFLVRSLFFNTPARRKFLKQPATEGGYIADLMEHLALSRPDISFKLTIGGQMKFHTSGNGDLKEVIYRIYGRDVARELVPIRAEQEGVSVQGYLGKPVQVRSNRNFEIYFINGRFIRSNVVSRAVEEGYKEYLMQHKFPLCVLHITMDARRVDVNVHPTKMDVRFGNAIEFSEFLMQSVRQALRCREMIPEASLSTERELKAVKAAEQKNKEQDSAPEPFEKSRGGTYRLMEETRYNSEQPKEREFFHNPVWSRVKGGSGLINGAAEADSAASDKTPDEAQRDPAPENVTRADVTAWEKTPDGVQRNTVPENVTRSDGTAWDKTPDGVQRELVPENVTKKVDVGDIGRTDKNEYVGQRFSVPKEASLPSERKIGYVGGSDEGGKSIAMLPPEKTAAFKRSGATENGSIICDGFLPIEEKADKEDEDSFFIETSELPEDTEAFVAEAAEEAAQKDNARNISSPPDNIMLSEFAFPQPSSGGVQLNLFEEKILTAENRSRFRIIGQVFETYWLIEFEDKLLMIDQHAAHEKVNYERLMKQYHEKSVLSQGLLPPVIVSLSGQEEAVLKDNMDTFSALGFEIEAFGGSEYALRSVPVDLYGCNEREMFLEVLDGLLSGTGFSGIRVIEEKIASMSCKAAVKGNNKMSTQEAEALIDELLTLDNPYNCPHGRPVIVSMTKTEMDRKFKRIVN